MAQEMFILPTADRQDHPKVELVGLRGWRQTPPLF